MPLTEAYLTQLASGLTQRTGSRITTASGAPLGNYTLRIDQAKVYCISIMGPNCAWCAHGWQGPRINAID